MEKRRLIKHNLSPEYKNDTRLKLFENRILRVDDVAELLGVSKGHVYNMVSDGRLKKRKRGRLFFFLEEILDWIEEGEMT